MAVRVYKKRLGCGCSFHGLACLNCGKLTCLLELKRHNELYCDACGRLAGKGKRLKHSSGCLIPGCRNRTDQGEFKRDLCMPCHNYIVEGTGTHSQAYRNELVKANFRFLAAMKPPRWSATPVMTFATMYGKAGR